MFIYTTDTIIKALTNTKHCSRNFKNYSVQISLFVYIHFFGLSALTTLEPSTSLTPHQPVPLSLCHWILSRCFAAPLQALSLVSTRIGRWWTPESLAIRWTRAVSLWEWLHRHLLWCGFLAIRSLPRHGKTPSPSVVSLWEDFLSLRSVAIAVGRVPTGRPLVVKLLCYLLVTCCIAILSLRLYKDTSPRIELRG
jgi:hypothetical protein